MNNPIHQTVIVGGGFTGLFTALNLSHQHYPRSVILIDRAERFSFKPLLYEFFSEEMNDTQVWPRFEDLLKGSGVIFVQNSVQSIDLQEQQVKLASGDCYSYSNLVLGLGSVAGYFGVEGAAENAFNFRTGEDAIAIDKHLHNCLQTAVKIENQEQRQGLLTIAVVGGGPSGVEMAATLADLLPHWYEALGGKPQEIRVVLLQHGQEILAGDVNSRLKATAEQELQKRAVPVQLLTGAEVTAVRSDAVEYKQDGQLKKLSAATTIWTAGTSTHPLLKNLPIPDKHRDKHGRLNVTPTLQLPDFPEVFAGGDCAVDLQSSPPAAQEYERPEPQKDQSTNSDEQYRDLKPLPPTAQVAYQQGAVIAHNLRALALGNKLKPAKVSLRGTLLKLGLDNGVANIFDTLEVKGEVGHLIRQGAYLELLPTPVHNFKSTAEWLNEETFSRQLNKSDVTKTAVRAMEVVGGAVVGVLVARKLLQALGDNKKHSS